MLAASVRSRVFLALQGAIEEGKECELRPEELIKAEKALRVLCALRGEEPPDGIADDTEEEEDEEHLKTPVRPWALLGRIGLYAPLMSRYDPTKQALKATL